MQKSRDTRRARRAQAILLLHEGYSVSEVSRLLHAARSAIREWRIRFERFGEAGLEPERAGRKPTTVTEEVCTHLLELIEKGPEEYGYLRSRWTTEMLARQLHTDLGVAIHASTVRRLLPKLGVRWNRARPTLRIPDPAKSAKMGAIKRALNKASDEEPVFYVDEVDIDFNPRIGNYWTRKRQQARFRRPGRMRNAIWRVPSMPVRVISSGWNGRRRTRKSSCGC